MYLLQACFLFVNIYNFRHSYIVKLIFVNKLGSYRYGGAVQKIVTAVRINSKGDGRTDLTCDLPEAFGGVVPAVSDAEQVYLKGNVKLK